MCEYGIKLLAEEELVGELSPPEEWRIHPSTEARDNGFQHKRRLLVKNELNAWHIVKIRQHAQDPTKLVGRSVTNLPQIIGECSSLVEAVCSVVLITIVESIRLV